MNEKYISQNLAQKLAEAGCKISSDWYYRETYSRRDNHVTSIEIRPREDFEKFDGSGLKLKSDKGLYEAFPAYDLIWDICIKHAKEFFGEDVVNCKSREFGYKSDLMQLEIGDKYPTHTIQYSNAQEKFREKMKGEKIKYDKLISVKNITVEIISLLQQNRKQEAEDYFWKVTVFNKKEK